MVRHTYTHIHRQVRQVGHRELMNPVITGGVCSRLSWCSGTGGWISEVPEVHSGMTEQLSTLAAPSKFR